ncbi:MAG: prepilin-type N-terminal cleavage/methylation domain-containing protein [Tissierellales bacterium]|nr:prepilin-type N-terminal cleavage/methylation domain-containing protein [Tissierellales bacterium]MBN2826880.1 prepilin-type N-terminal cleavage/methylation domain-containing protein [Tissierellales bacterium]
MKMYKRNNKGLTLIELVISVALLSFVLIGFLNFFVYGNLYVSHARQKSNTSVEAQNIVNESIELASPALGASSSEINLTINLTPSASVSIDVTQVTATDTNGNQSSTITTVIP